MESATGAKNSPQITVFSDLAEHLPDAEGLEGLAWPGAPKSPWNRRHSGSRCLGPRILGTGFGNGRAVGTERSVAQDVVRVVRVLSESTNSSM